MKLETSSYEDRAVLFMAKELGVPVTEDTYSELLCAFEDEPRWQTKFGLHEAGIEVVPLDLLAEAVAEVVKENVRAKSAEIIPFVAFSTGNGASQVREF